MIFKAKLKIDWDSKSLSSTSILEAKSSFSAFLLITTTSIPKFLEASKLKLKT